MVTVLFSLCGAELIPLIQWTPHKQQYTKREDMIVEVTLRGPNCTPRTFHLSSNTSALLLYKEVSEHIYLALQWNNSVIYPGGQTLHDMEFSSQETISFSYEQVSYINLYTYSYMIFALSSLI